MEPLNLYLREAGRKGRREEDRRKVQHTLSLFDLPVARVGRASEWTRRGLVLLHQVDRVKLLPGPGSAAVEMPNRLVVEKRNFGGIHTDSAGSRSLSAGPSRSAEADVSVRSLRWSLTYLAATPIAPRRKEDSMRRWETNGGEQ
eukprot:753644-Hanusia_phi.AAC.8